MLELHRPTLKFFVGLVCDVESVKAHCAVCNANLTYNGSKKQQTPQKKDRIHGYLLHLIKNAFRSFYLQNHLNYMVHDIQLVHSNIKYFLSSCWHILIVEFTAQLNEI